MSNNTATQEAQELDTSRISLAYFLDFVERSPINRNKAFDDSPLNKYWGNPSGKAKGAFGERLYNDIVQANGYCTEKATNSEHDVRVLGKKVEVKLASINTEGKFILNQVKTKGDYEMMVVILVEPHEVSAWFASKEEILSLNSNQQHQNEEVMIVAKKEEITDVCKELNFSTEEHGLSGLTEEAA